MSDGLWVDENGKHASWVQMVLMLYAGRSWGDYASLFREIGVLSYMFIGFNVYFAFMSMGPYVALFLINFFVFLHVCLCLFGYMAQRNVRRNQEKYGYLSDLHLFLQAERSRNYEEFKRLVKKWWLAPSQYECDRLEAQYDSVKGRLSNEIINIVESNRREIYPECTDNKKRMTLCRSDYKTVVSAIKSVRE